MSSEPDHSEQIDTHLKAHLNAVAGYFEPTRVGADVLPDVQERASCRAELRHRRQRLLGAAAAAVLLVGGGAGAATLLGHWPGGSSQRDVRTDDRVAGPVAPSPSDPPGTQPDPGEPDEAPDVGDHPAPPLAARWKTAMVWTGEELVIWGGELDAANMGISGAENTTYTDGAAYDPVAREWRSLPESPLPGGRGIQAPGPQAVWTGTEVLVVEGGEAAAWDPTSNSWREVASPPGEGLSGFVSTGDEVVQLDPDGGATWDPEADEWEPVADPPADFEDGVAVWTGEEIVLLETTSLNPPLSGPVRSMAYEPGADQWRTLETTELTAAVAATWTGQEVLVAGYDNVRTAATYDLARDTWNELPALPLPNQEGLPSVYMLGQTPVVWSYAGVAVLLEGGWYPVSVAPTSVDFPVAGAGVLWTLGLDYDEEPPVLTVSEFRPPETIDELNSSVLRLGFSDLRLPDGFAAEGFESFETLDYDTRIVAELAGPGGVCEVASGPGAPGEGDELEVDPLAGPNFPAVRTGPGRIELTEGEGQHRVIEIACDAPDDADTLVRHLTPWT